MRSPHVNFTRIRFNIMVLAIWTRAGLTVFKITVCVYAMFMTSTVGKSVALNSDEDILLVKLNSEDDLLVKLRWNLRSGDLGLSPPVDGDSGADGEIGNDHDTGVEEDEGLRCNL